MCFFGGASTARRSQGRAKRGQHGPTCHHRVCSGFWANTSRATEIAMGDRFDQFLLRQAVLPREGQMGSKLVRSVHGDQRAYRDEGAVALGELRTLPRVAEQHRVGQLGEFRRDIPHQGLSARLHSGARRRRARC